MREHQHCDIERWLWEIGEAGARLDRLGALEGSAGNISLFAPRDTPGLDRLLADRLPRAATWSVPHGVNLPPGVLIVTGAGCRLRDASARPEQVLCAIELQEPGVAWLHRAPHSDVEPTSEIDSHLGVHSVALAGAPALHAVVHAQPPNLTYLSHIATYRDVRRLNRQLLRWQPETIVTFPHGLGVLPFATPGTPAQGRLTAAAMRRYQLVVWAGHGVIVRSGKGPLAASDLIEYAEAAAAYEVRDLMCGRPADGLSLSEIRAVADRFGVVPDVLDDLPETLLGKRDGDDVHSRGSNQ